MTRLVLCAGLLAGGLPGCTGDAIPFPPAVPRDGAARVLGTLDRTPSPYFRHPDFFNLGATATRTLLPRFKTYQQTTEYTCGPAALVMVAEYRGTRLNEREVAAAVGATAEKGTSTEQMQKLRS